ncbi:MAG: hypothetical protein AAGF11_53980 [Myxococcota bacterium]
MSSPRWAVAEILGTTRDGPAMTGGADPWSAPMRPVTPGRATSTLGQMLPRVKLDT